MYAVGKFGGLISRGAVDIIVVQQQDGSFKSSPWYVRFGKFQGVRKSGEKVVNISVNGVEAGFHMYLDSNGEAYFLRNTDPDGEEGEFIVSAASSGDEREAVPVQEAQLRKSKSTSCDSSTMEADVGDGKILMRTTSRRTTILERMFGRKTVKNNAHALDRVSSLERAEIAAELLDTKWSTNLPRNLKTHRSNDEPSKSKLAESRNNDQMEISKNVLPEYSLDHGNEMESNCNGADYKFCSTLGGRNSFADLTDQSLQTTLVKEGVVEIHTHETSDFTDRTTFTVRQPGSESLLNNLGTDKSIHESVDTQGELLHKSEDVAGREMHTREAFSNSIFEIHTIKTDTTSGKSEVVSQFVTVDSDGANQILAGANSATYATTDVSTGKHEVTLVPPTQDPVQEEVVILSISETLEISQDAVQDKMVILSSSETMKSSYVVSDISDHKVQDEEDSRVSNGSKEQLTSEEKSLAPSKEKDMVKVVVEEHEAFILEDPTPPILVDNGPDMDISVDNVSLSHTSVAHDLACQHDVVCPNASSRVVETSSYVPDNDPEGATENLIVENKACNRELDVSVTQTSTIGDVPTDCIAQSANFPNKIELEGSSTVTGSSSLVNAEVHNIKTEDETNRFSYVSGDEAGFVREAIAETEEEADAIVPFSEYTEETQFQFSDTENFADRKAMGNIVAKETAGEGNLDESDCDTEKQEGGDVDIANILESCSHIHDLGRSDRFELSYSLQSNAENNGFDPVKSTDSAFLEEKSEITGDSEEISLCRHLLSEGMGEDAACSAFYSEKITLEKFHTMKLSLTRNNKLVVRIVGRYFPWDAAVPIVLGLISFSEEQETYNLAIQTHQPNGQFGIGIPFGRVIVGCKPDKIEECLTKQLFGLPSANCADTDVAKASVIENSHSDTGKKESEEAVSNWENLDGNAVSLELGIDLPLFLHSGTAYGDELHSGTIVPTFWCMCFSVVKSANQVRVLMKKDSGDTMAVEERLIAVKVEWSPTVLFSPHFKLSWLDPNHKIASSVRMQWDPGIGTATAWGQAVFRGGGNVMTHICQERPKITKAHLPKLQPKKPKPSAPIEGTTSTSGQASNRIRYRTEKRRKPVAVFFLRHPTPSDFLCDQLTLPEFISPVSNGSLHGEPVRTRCE